MKRKNNPITDKTILEQLFQIMKKDFMVIKEAVACQQIVQLIEAHERLILILDWLSIYLLFFFCICKQKLFIHSSV